jgi:hypothetical protein
VRNLERLGYPPAEVRKRNARRAADEYARAIARGVERQSGVRGVVRPDGSIDCRRLARLARTVPPR